jgi:hypothetical protein
MPDVGYESAMSGSVNLTNLSIFPVFELDDGFEFGLQIPARFYLTKGDFCI